jgi:hypothetical protein
MPPMLLLLLLGSPATTMVVPVPCSCHPHITNLDTTSFLMRYRHLTYISVEKPINAHFNAFDDI